MRANPLSLAGRLRLDSRPACFCAQRWISARANWAPFNLQTRWRSDAILLAVKLYRRSTPRLMQKELAVTETARFTILCPCCEATLVVDSQTGAIISHEEKAKPLASFEEMAKGLEKQKHLREQLFSQELGSQKDRERLLEEKFREAMKRAEKDKDKPLINPLDLD